MQHSDYSMQKHHSKSISFGRIHVHISVFITLHVLLRAMISLSFSIVHNVSFFIVLFKVFKREVEVIYQEDNVEETFKFEKMITCVKKIS